MRTVFIGGGKGCRAVLELAAQHKLATLSLEVMGVVDIDPQAPAMRYARDRGWTTFTAIEEAINTPRLELVIELTGIDAVRDEVNRLAPRDVRVMDHYMARVFWDLDEVAEHLRDELQVKTRLEQAISEDRLRLQEILDSLPDVVMVVDQDGRIERVNRRFEVVAGRAAAEVVGRRCSEEVCGYGNLDACRQASCPRLAVEDTGRPVTMIQLQSCIGSTAEDQECFHEVTANPIRGADGRTQVVVTSREVTEQIMLKRETEQAARRFDQIMSMVHGIITIKDLQGRYQLVNPAASRFMGLPASAFAGKTVRDLFSPEVADIVERNDADVARQGGHLTREERLTFNGREQVLVSERILLSDYRDQPVGICCVSRNETEQRRLQGELLQSEKHAAVGKLAAGVAHELNNPLTGILTFAEDLRDDARQGTTAHEDLELIVRETLRCRQIVRELLDFSRRTPPDRQLVGIGPIIQRALSLVRNQATFHDIQLQQRLVQPRLMVRVDPNQIQQVILNLVINARDAMDGKGRIVVRTRELADPPRLAVEIVDNGCGVPEELLERIFEPFFSTKGDQGMGLGLASVRSIVEQHEGQIAVESAEGQGSVFRMLLPGVPVPGSRTDQANEGPAPAAGGSP